MVESWSRQIRHRFVSPLRAQSPELRQRMLVTQNLKGWGMGLPAAFEVPPQDRVPPIIAVGGGKGGVGKSLVSANLAAAIGGLGRKVLVCDLDFGSANLHTHFGVGLPAKTLSDYLHEDLDALQSLVVQTPAGGVSLLPGSRDDSGAEATVFADQRFSTLWDDLISIMKDYDCLILDLGAGTHRSTIDLFLSAHVGIIATLPEPTSIENAYSFLKATLRRLIENVGARGGYCAASEDLRAQVFGSGSSSGSLKDQIAKKSDPRLLSDLTQAIEARLVGIVMNQIRNQREIDVGKAMVGVSRKFFGLNCQDYGYLNYDPTVWQSLRAKSLLLRDFTHSMISQRLRQVAGQVLDHFGDTQ